ncbi:MAG: bifunctional (p)ppGpp synthetase/guanosine-3',5'-bis(diphosphate) 3'-pyrophosphohydrolase, partial [Gammaproteobacteria bacterium]|nr:bifunctional (p)ppGpp synthetase/guanosine-3',5'-bis(diphosphate) 3'-pyrophosphohydrolase [Gammaproteobacteria bacterium]
VAGWLNDQNKPDLLLIGLELSELVADLKMDQASVLAALVYRGVRENRLAPAALAKAIGSEPMGIAQSVAAMATTSLLEMTNSPILEKEHQDQVENIKRMLVSLIQDARVAVVKLAERVLALRHAKNDEGTRRQRIALEAQQIFAPLAGRLGIWQLKWELEDLSLRYLERAAYQDIAKNLAGKRVEREAQVEHIIDQVRGLLRGHGIDAVVYGRAKHIYSIWRKMQKKGVPVEQVHDMRAVRVVVDTLAECYAALGVLHNTWAHIPREFDDYVANPKENGYQSIHTAVTAADGRTLEIQIRTKRMHEDAELGVCAHWSYKGGQREEGSYADKMDWLRQVMQWHDELAGKETLRDLLQNQVREDRIFVATPKGHVLDLPSGATVLDFAYRVHTDLGHGCRGAQVNAMLVPLNRVLETGQKVQVISGNSKSPQRDWLEPSLGYVVTDRARAKIYTYFRGLSQSEQIEVGHQTIESKLDALGLGRMLDADLSHLLNAQGLPDPDALYAAVGTGARSSVDWVIKMLEDKSLQGQLSLFPAEVAPFPGTHRFELTGENRAGLLHDITQVIGDLCLPLTGTWAQVNHATAQAMITVDVTLVDWPQSVRLVSYLNLIDGVAELRKAAAL